MSDGINYCSFWVVVYSYSVDFGYSGVFVKYIVFLYFVLGYFKVVLVDVGNVGDRCFSWVCIDGKGKGVRV